MATNILLNENNKLTEYFDQAKLNKYMLLLEQESLAKIRAVLNPQDQNDEILKSSATISSILEKSKLFYFFGTYLLYKRYINKNNTKMKALFKSTILMFIPLLFIQYTINISQIAAKDIMRERVLSGLSDEEYKEYTDMFKLIYGNRYIKI